MRENICVSYNGTGAEKGREHMKKLNNVLVE